MTNPREKRAYPEAPPFSVAGFEAIIDCSQAQFNGTWSTSSFQPNSFNGSYRITNRMAFSTEPRVASWRPRFPSGGDYTVSIWLPDGHRDRSNNVTYRLHHAGEISEYSVDQTRSGGRWNQLGRRPFRFDGSGQEFLELRVADVAPGAIGEAVYVQADAVRFASPPSPITTAPNNVKVTNAPNFLELTWNSLLGADTYLIRRTTDGSNGTVEQVVEDATYLDLDVTSGFAYTYAIAGMNGSGVGVASSVTATPSQSVPLQAVQGLEVKTVGRVPVLSWHTTNDTSAYLVQRALRSGGEFITIARVTDTTFADFLAGNSAHYRIRSTNDHGDCALTSWQVNWRRR